MTFKKKYKTLAIVFVTMVLTGCGNSARDKIDSGMQAIENLEYDVAITNLQEALAEGENARLAYRGLGIASMGLTDYTAAIEAFETCLQLSDGFVKDIDYDVNYYLATSYFRNGDTARAEGVYSSILALKPNETNARYMRGCVYLAEGKYDDAMADFERILSSTNYQSSHLISIYESLSQYGYGEAGKELLENALSQYESSYSSFDKGRIYYYLEEYQRACMFLEEAREGNQVEAYLYLGRAYEATGDYNYAVSVYNAYLAKDSTNASVYNQLGLCEIKRQEYQSALTAFQAAMNIEENGMMQTLRFNEIITLEHLGEFRQAAVLMDNYLKIYPDDESAKREYEFLKTR